MSKKYMSRPGYSLTGLPEYFTPPMTVEEYKACEAKYFDFLKNEETKVEKRVGTLSRFLRFIGKSKNTALAGGDAHVQQPFNKSQGGGDKGKSVRTLHRIESRENRDKTLTHKAGAELDVNCNTTSYKLKEDPSDLSRDVHAVTSHESIKEFKSCRLQLLEGSPGNDVVIDELKVKPKRNFCKSLRNFFRRPFKSCHKAEE